MRNLILASLILASTANAASLSKDIKRLASLVDVGTNGGDTYINKYDVKKFSYGPIVKALLENIEGSDCSFVPLIGTTKVESNFSNMSIFNNRDEAEKLLSKLFEQKKVKAAIGRLWDGDRGDSEYCSTEELELFFTNGEVLSIIYDSTT